MSIGSVFIEIYPLLLRGLLVTLKLTVVSLIIAFIIGLLSCVFGLSKSKILRAISKFYIWLIRGTPILVQCYFFYFGMPQLVQNFIPDFRISAFVGGIITLSLNAGAYMSEIFRGGIQAVDKGQMEAARSLGMPKSRAMIKVILPQAIKISIPSLVNQFIISLKDTSIISVIALGEIVYEARIYIGRTMQPLNTWTIVALFYLVIITILSEISKHIERRLDNESQS